MGQLREFEKFFDMAMWQFVGSQRLDFGRVAQGEDKTVEGTLPRFWKSSP